ncbi:proline-specific peptidase [Marasmius fiardii PR-910]|nr:proline-specific peptidase [Marasmius fiardii PR-910]
MSSQSTVDFVVGERTFKTWYVVFGDLKSGKTPLVLLHGGPGFSHHYMLANKALYEKVRIPLVLYDQIGSGNSSHYEDAPTDFWKPELFMDQLDGLISYLGIADNFDLLGHSWGGMLAGQYAASRVPPGLRRLIISNAPASVATFEEGIHKLLQTRFPKDFYDMVKKHEREGTTDSKEYQGASELFMEKHVCTVDPWPEEFMQSVTESQKDKTVYSSMWGSAEFTILGTLKTWTITDILHRINVPTLLISAPLDEVQVSSVMPWFLNVPKIKWVELQDSTHLAQFEEPERYFKVILDFLTSS